MRKLSISALLAFVIVRFATGPEAAICFAQSYPNEDVIGKVDGLFQSAWPEQDVQSAGIGFWPQYRGPTGDGHADHSNTPTEWSETKNVVWKTPIHGRAWSSPVIWGDDIWLTTATQDGKQQSAICVNRHTGKIRIDRVVFTNAQVQPDHHVTNTYASPTPILDGQRTYVHFGAYGTAALDSKTGDTIWERRDLPCNHFRGPGSSPILFGNALIFHMDGFDYKYVIALDKRTGQTIWKVDRQIEYGTDNGDIHKAFATPQIIRVEGELQMISPASKATIAYSPWTGEEIWRVRYDEYSVASRPLFDGKRLYLSTGFAKAKMLAVRVGGKGDVTKTHVDWVETRFIGSKPSQVLVNGLLFSVEDRGIAACFRADTGQLLWQDRLGGEFSSSPVVADNRVYFFDHDGNGYVYSATAEKNLLSKNRLETGCRASAAIIGDQLIVRTEKHLYCLENSR